MMIVATIAMGAVLATSCCNCEKKAEGECCNEKQEFVNEGGPEGECRGQHGKKHHGQADGPREMCSPEMKEMCEKWANFDSLSADEQKALIQERKAKIDQREAEMAAEKAEFEQKWANFDNLSVEEQKQLLDIKSGCCKEKRGEHMRPLPKKDDNMKPHCKGKRDRDERP